MTTRVDASSDAAGMTATAAGARGWDVYAIALSDDPHRRWREIRESTPVLDAGGGVFFVTRWASVDAVSRDPRHRAGAGVAASFGVETGLALDVMRAWLMSLDGPPQQRARDLVRREFTPRRIEGLRPTIEAITDRLVGEIESNVAVASSDAVPHARRERSVDLVPALAFALPSEVIRTLFGFEPDLWRERIEAIVRGVGPTAADGIRMIEGLARAFDERLRSGDVPDGLLAQLSRPDPELGALSPLEVVANAVLLVTAAIDTTAGLVGNAIACLLERPALVARLRREPDLAPAIVEETLRFEPSALSFSRTAGVDFELEGVAIPAGSQLLLSIGAAHRDPRRFPDPDRFDVDRDPSGLLSFGGGRHFCLGAALARLEARIVLERLFIRGRADYGLAEKPCWQKRNPTIRAYDSLRVVGTRRGDGTRGGDAREASDRDEPPRHPAED